MGMHGVVVLAVGGRSGVGVGRRWTTNMNRGAEFPEGTIWWFDMQLYTRMNPRRKPSTNFLKYGCFKYARVSADVISG